MQAELQDETDFNRHFHRDDDDFLAS